MLRERRPSGRWLLSLAAASVLLGAGGWVPASAQTTIASCPTQGLTLAAVEITSPKADSTITAGAQRVTGRLFEGLTRVELYIDGVLTDARSVPQGQESFDLTWQATTSLPRTVAILVVGCGSGIGQLLRASDEVRVRLTPVDTTRPSPSSTVVTPSTAAPVRTTIASTATTTAAAGTASAGAASSTTTKPEATTVPTTVVSTTTAPPATTATRQANTPLVLSEKADEDEPGPPLWVGAVVGLSGTLGLALSALISRRSAAKAARSQLPVEESLDADDGSDLVSL
jgi:hypothetical protein